MSFLQSAKSFPKENSGSSLQAPIKFSPLGEKSSYHIQNSRNFFNEEKSTHSSFLKTQNSKTPETLFSKKSLSNTDSQEFSQQNPVNISTVKEENIDISPWIQKNLILMDVFNQSSELETPKEILFQAVRNCPTLEEFIIEKKKDAKTGRM